jgi:sugar phosphate isomerase/epimerase
MITRRIFTRSLLLPAAAPLTRAARIDSTVHGVRLGAQSYSFRDRDLDACIAAMQQIGLGYCELWSGHFEPKDNAAKPAWRKNPPLEDITAIRGKFDRAGIQICALNYSFRPDWSDQEIENGFRIANALGVDKITASSTVPTAKRIDPFARKYKTWVAMHNHSRISPGEFARPEDFAEAMNGASKYICVNLDIGHFHAAGFDPVSYIEQNHDRIVTLHIKDRKENQGANVPFGEGTTPIKPVLQLLKKKKSKIYANIEYEYKGSDTVAEVKKCFEYCKAALA